MILLWLFIKGIRACVWCLGWMIWACLALAGVLLVGSFALCCIPLGIAGQIWRDGLRSLAPPAYLIRKSRV